ncbi:MAG: DUF3467 domain-containing protein [Bacteroidales bacterium]|nr:DUF3467 domain-containing protein [Bacteroidales bacterium]
MNNQDNNQPKPGELNIELSAEVAEGTYANLAVITHSHAEFILDFVRVMPGMPKAPVKSRVIITPEHAKRLMHALQDNLKKYESTFGKIKGDDQDPHIPMGFGGPTAQA